MKNKSKEKTVKLDSSDKDILRILQKNNLLSQKDIAKEVGLSTPAVQRRISDLHKMGVIESNIAVVRPEYADHPVTAIAEVWLEDERTVVVERTKKLFLSQPEVQQCYYVNGGVSFVLILVAPTLPAYEEILRHLFADNKDIKTYKTLIVLNRVKVGLQLPL